MRWKLNSTLQMLDYLYVTQTHFFLLCIDPCLIVDLCKVHSAWNKKNQPYLCYVFAYCLSLIWGAKRQLLKKLRVHVCMEYHTVVVALDERVLWGSVADNRDKAGVGMHLLISPCSLPNLPIYRLLSLSKSICMCMFRIYLTKMKGSL